MTTYAIPYGRKTLNIKLPQTANIDVIAPKQAPPASGLNDCVASGLESINLEAISNAKSVVIAINDKTRPVPHKHLLPPLLKMLELGGVQLQEITLIIATGAHPPMKVDEFSKVVPREISSRYRVISHDCDDAANLAYLGTTARGTPVWVNRTYIEADLRIVVGNIEPHQFQGFSGGVKSAAIGLAGRETIKANHAWMSDPQARLGEYKHNPARQDVEEIGALIGIHFALNVILNAEKEIVHVVAGDPNKVMSEGIPLARQIYQVEVDNLYDLVIAAPGGHPKDINLYQAQKSLAHAALVTHPRGTIIMTAACPQGIGEERCENWLVDTPSLEAILARFRREGFHLGSHKAYQIARDVAQRTFYLYSDMPPAQVEGLHLNPVINLDSLLVNIVTPEKQIAIMPYANATIPCIKE